MIFELIVKLFGGGLYWRQKYGAWVLYAGMFELCYFHRTIDVDGSPLWLLCIDKPLSDGWDAVDFDSLELGIIDAEKWAVESGFGKVPARFPTRMFREFERDFHLHK